MSQRLSLIVLNCKTKSQEKDEATITRIEYYISSGYLKEETTGALKLIVSKAKETIEQILKIEAYTKAGFEYHIRADNLPVISFDSFIYGMSLLFMGVLEHKLNIDINGIVFYLDIMIIILLLHCIIYDRITNSQKNCLRPRMVIHLIFFVLAISAIYRYNLKSLWGENVNVLVSLLTCYIGYITYFLISFIGCLYKFVMSAVKIFHASLPRVVKEHEKDFKKYSLEFREIDEKINSNFTGPNFSIRGDEQKTKANQSSCS